MSADNRPPAPGGRALTIASVLFITSGSLWGIIFFFMVLHLADARGMPALGFGIMFFSIIITAGQLLPGIIGYKNANNVEKAKATLAAGILALAVALPVSVLMFTTREPILVFISITVLALPVVYLYGTGKNLKAQKDEKAS